LQGPSKNSKTSSRGVNKDTHDQTSTVQAKFAKDVRCLVSVLEEFGNTFEEDNADRLIV